MIRIASIGLMASVLTGCIGNAEDDFLCAAQLGSPCSTIAQADGGGGAGAHLVTEREEDRLSDTISQEPLGVGKTGTAAFAGMPDGGALPSGAAPPPLPPPAGVRATAGAAVAASVAGSPGAADAEARSDATSPSAGAGR